MCGFGIEDGIVATPNEADMGLILGIGFPPHHGGALKYADTLGLQTVIDKCAQYAHLGKLYEPTERMKEMAAGTVGNLFSNVLRHRFDNVLALEQLKVVSPAARVTILTGKTTGSLGF